MEVFGITVNQIFYFFFTLGIVVLVFLATRKLLNRQIQGQSDRGIIRTIVLSCIFLIGAIMVILALPISSELKGQITSLIGIVLAAALSISSATFLGNALGGIFLSVIKNFKLGDFISVNEIFGRVTERGLFHTEIQTIDRDLITVPNMFLANNPVKVTRASGTFISAVCSLGYDVSRIKIEKVLLSAAKEAGLLDAFVHIVELGDFSVVYKVHGLLRDVKTVLSARSRLYGQMLDALHTAGIEIVSPSFMNQRQVNETVFIPKKAKSHEIKEIEKINQQSSEQKIFDKADEAESIEKRRKKIQEYADKIVELKNQIESADSSVDTVVWRNQLEKYTTIRERLQQSVKEKLSEIDNKE